MKAVWSEGLLRYWSHLEKLFFILSILNFFKVWAEVSISGKKKKQTLKWLLRRQNFPKQTKPCSLGTICLPISNERNTWKSLQNKRIFSTPCRGTIECDLYFICTILSLLSLLTELCCLKTFQISDKVISTILLPVPRFLSAVPCGITMGQCCLPLPGSESQPPVQSLQLCRAPLLSSVHFHNLI